jgi:hypothetical protein
MTWLIVILWLGSDQRLPTPTGTMLQARETFATEAQCVAAIPRFEAAVQKDFGEAGIVACAVAAGAVVAAKRD